MRRVLLVVASLLAASQMMVRAVDFGPFVLGFHLIPEIETKDGRRSWDLSMSFGVTMNVTDADSVELTAIIDSAPSALGATVTYERAITEHVMLGAGLTALWPITREEELRTPLYESFARAGTQTGLGGGITGGISASLPFLTVAYVSDRWTIIPLADLPSISLTGDIALTELGSLELDLTLQPVITDTTALEEPFGRITDDLLVLPMLSASTKYRP